MNAGIMPPILGLLPSIEAIGSPGSAEAVREVFPPLHLGGAISDLTILFILLGGLTSSVLATIGVLAFSQRRSRPYLYVSLVLGMLAVKAFVGGLTVFQIVPVAIHHTVEHALDFATALCLIIAIYYARLASNTSGARSGSTDSNDKQAITDSRSFIDD